MPILLHEIVNSTSFIVVTYMMKFTILTFFKVYTSVALITLSFLLCHHYLSPELFHLSK